MRIIFPIILLLFIFLQKRTKKIDLYKLSLLLFFLFLSFRFAQGTDYLNYYQLFYKEVTLDLFLKKGFYSTHFEFLYNAMVLLFRSFGLSFHSLVAFISFVDLYYINKFIKKYSDNKIASLLILYLAYGIVFLESALRQSIAMSIILGICFVGFSDRKPKKMLIGSVLAFLFHKSSIIISVVLFILYFIESKYDYLNIELFCKKNYTKIFIFIIALVLVVNIFPYNNLFEIVPGQLGYKLRYYFSISSYSPVSILLRVVLLLLFLILINDKNYKINNRRKFVICSIYLFGFIFYFLVCKFSLLSRVTVYFEIVEIVLYAQLLNNFSLFKKIFKKCLLVFYCLLISLLFIKDGIATQKQSNFKNVSVICPYYNIFQRKKAIKNFKWSDIKKLKYASSKAK